MDTVNQPVPPHCDAAILHAPGVCEYCDEYPQWQELRMVWRVNFTGEMLAGMTPCPSVWFRDPLVRDLWGGNIASPPV
jgi:hypothetical protein